MRLVGSYYQILAILTKKPYHLGHKKAYFLTKNQPLTLKKV